LASPGNINGITTGKVARNLSKQRLIAPIQASFVSLGCPDGSGNRCNFCRINSSGSGSKTEANSGDSASDMTRRAVSGQVHAKCADQYRLNLDVARRSR
jgi:hypothetical protein